MTSFTDIYALAEHVENKFDHLPLDVNGGLVVPVLNHMKENSDIGLFTALVECNEARNIWLPQEVLTYILNDVTFNTGCNHNFQETHTGDMVCIHCGVAW